MVTPFTSLLIVKVFALFILVYCCNCVAVDENGYIVYCPCMGRFGNQAEQFLGSLLFALHLNRTLVLPPFIEYQNYRVNFLPFDQVFQIDPLLEKHRVITMEKFMEKYAPLVWSNENRFILCYSPRNGPDGTKDSDCNPFEGSPFKPFWHHFNVTKFRKSVFHSPLVTQFSEAGKWKSRYKDLNVLAFVGPPSTFPANQEALPLQRYLKFSKHVKTLVSMFRNERSLVDKPFLAIHLRHGSDWIKACNLLKQNEMSQLFSSHQCSPKTGSQLKETILPFETCLHSTKSIIKSIRNVLEDPPDSISLQTIYVATDYDNKQVWHELSQAFPDKDLITPTSIYSKGKIVKQGLNHPHFLIDAYLLSHANYFIGNCISSFSAFASRSRVYGLKLKETTTFFAYDLLKNSQDKDEL